MPPEIIAEFIEIERERAIMPAYVAVPPSDADTIPSVVLCMHVWGVDESMRDVARRFADNGFVAIVPDLYARFNAPSGDGATDHTQFIGYARQLSAETVEPDLQSSVSWLHRRRPRTKIAIAGFCMGGTMAMQRSARYAGTFSAAAIWYGFKPEIKPEEVDIPIVASYGAQDSGIPAEKIEAFRAGLRVPNDVKIYPNAAHGFFDSRPSYNAAAAEDSWNRTIAFLNRHLK